MSYRFVLAALLAGGILSNCADTPAETLIGYTVEIIRDDYGIPHIYGKKDADAVYGMIYAQAEDDFPRIERNYIWATGRLAEVEGEAALFSDLRARLYMSVDEAKAAYASAPEDLKALCDAWAAGLNDYLADYPEVTPRLLTRFEPWMRCSFQKAQLAGILSKFHWPELELFTAGIYLPRQCCLKPKIRHYF